MTVMFSFLDSLPHSFYTQQQEKQFREQLLSTEYGEKGEVERRKEKKDFTYDAVNSVRFRFRLFSMSSPSLSFISLKEQDDDEEEEEEE